MARILVIEDDPMARRAVSATLASLHHRVTEACSDDEGMAFLSSAHADLIITDIAMPQTGGFEILRRIQQHRPVAKVIVTFSGDCVDETDCRELAKYLGASSTLAKPFFMHELLAAVNELLPATQPPRCSSRGTSPPLLPLSTTDFWQMICRRALPST